MKACARCRRGIDDDATFCPHCGHSIEAAARRERLLSARQRSRRLVGALVVLLALSLGLRLLSDRAGEERVPLEPDLAAARSALAESDWAAAMRSLSPSGEVPPGAEARALLATALHERCLAEGGAGFPRAARVRELSLADDPTDLPGLRARAELESSFGGVRRAASWWEVALVEAERQGVGAELWADLLLDTAVARAVAGEPVRAELLLEQLLGLSPGHPRGLVNRGLLHLEAGRFALARADLEAAAAGEPGLVAARAGLLELARRQGRDGDAATIADGLQGASSIMVHHGLALRAEDLGDSAEAERQLEAARSLAPAEGRLRR